MIKTKLILLLLVGTLVACGSSYNANINIQSASYLNPNIDNNAAPVFVTLYELKNANRFSQSTYAELTTDSTEILGADLIDKHIVEVRPNDRLTLKQPLSENTRYLGIVAAYRNIEDASWNALIEVSPENKNNILLFLESQGLTVKNR